MNIFGRPDKTISITTNTLIKAILVAAIAIIGYQMIGSISHELKLIAISLFLAIGLNPAVTWITVRIKSKSRLRATGAAYIIVITLLIGFLSLVIPPLVKQTTKFVTTVPSTLNALKTQDSPLANTLRRYQLNDYIDEAVNNFKDRFDDDLSKPIISTAGRVGGTVVSIITVLILTFMMLVEGPIWFNQYLALQPEKLRSKRKKTIKSMYRVITGFFYGQMLIAFIAATFAAIMLLILNAIFGVSVNAIALSGIVFIFGLIPLVGNIIAAGIVVLICLISSWPMALIMLGFFILYQQIENATLQPYIQSRKNQLTPLTVFIAALLGAGLGGVLGALAAIPLVGCARILLEDYIKEHFPDYEDFNKHNSAA
ncbi:MAG: AI-2E family transporter [Candidatus Saccharimonadales bacterium]